MPGFYAPQLTEDTSHLRLEDEEFHHITHVFRFREGDIITLNSGVGYQATGTITHIAKKHLDCDLSGLHYLEKASPSIAVAFALLRNRNDEWLVEKLTELGVKDLYPMVTANAVRQPSKNVVDKFVKTAVAAIKQCDNPWLPIIHPVSDMEELLPKLRQQQLHPVVASEKHRDLLISDVLPQNQDRVCILIGPEGGFSDQEFRFFEQNEVPTFTLGNNILRAETAAITAVAQLLASYLKQNPTYR